MRFSKLNPLLRASTSNLQDSATPSSINYAYNFGSLLGLLMTMMVASGILLAIHYIGTSVSAFGSVEHIMTDVRLGYFIRYLHANTASLVFIAMYCHVIRNVYYSSYRQPRSGTFLVGQVIVILIIGTAFLGYSLVFGQMSLWGATVISNLATAVPYIGVDIATLLWGAYSVSSPTITKFYSLHYLLALVVLAFAVIHLLILHMHASSTPLGTAGSYDRMAMQPLFLVKDGVTMLIAFGAVFALIAYAPNLLGHSDNFVEANNLVTPSSIVPEWYLLFAYAILRSVPNKLVGVVLMLLAIVWLSALIFDVSIIRSNTFKPLNRTLLAIGLFAFVMLTSLGAKHIEVPFVLTGQVIALLYFIVLLVMVPMSGLLENYLSSSSSTRSDSHTVSAGITTTLHMPSGARTFSTSAVAYRSTRSPRTSGKSVTATSKPLTANQQQVADLKAKYGVMTHPLGGSTTTAAEAISNTTRAIEAYQSTVAKSGAKRVPRPVGRYDGIDLDQLPRNIDWRRRPGRWTFYSGTGYSIDNCNVNYRLAEQQRAMLVLESNRKSSQANTLATSAIDLRVDELKPYIPGSGQAVADPIAPQRTLFDNEQMTRFVYRLLAKSSAMDTLFYHLMMSTWHEAKATSRNELANSSDWSIILAYAALKSMNSILVWCRTLRSTEFFNYATARPFRLDVQATWFSMTDLYAAYLIIFIILSQASNLILASPTNSSGYILDLSLFDLFTDDQIISYTDRMLSHTGIKLTLVGPHTLLLTHDSLPTAIKYLQSSGLNTTMAGYDAIELLQRS